MSNKDEDEEEMLSDLPRPLSDLPRPIAILIMIGIVIAPVVLSAGTIHVAVRFFDGLPAKGGWPLAMVYSAFCLFYLAARYRALWRR